MRKRYPTDLSEVEGACLEPHLPAPKAYERPRLYPLRGILNVIYLRTNENHVSKIPRNLALVSRTDTASWETLQSLIAPEPD